MHLIAGQERCDGLRCQADGDADADTFGCDANGGGAEKRRTGAQGCEACPPVGIRHVKQLGMHRSCYLLKYVSKYMKN